MADLEKEFSFYRDNKKQFLKEYKGKFIVIKGSEIIGVFNEEIEAIEETKKNYELGTFLVQHVRENDDTAFFYSRIQIGNTPAV